MIQRSLVYEDQDVHATDDVTVTPDVGREVPGPGSLDTLLVVADADSFGVRVESDETVLVSDDFTSLEKWSAELAHVAAYTTDDDERVLSVSEFPYGRSIRARITVTSPLTLQRIRAVYTIGQS